jgi:hypothetical protein
MIVRKFGERQRPAFASLLHNAGHLASSHR